MSTKTVGSVGLYLVNGTAGKVGTPGAPIFHFSLLVNAVTGAVTGHGKLTQAVAPPLGDIPIVITSGQVHSTGFGSFTKVVSLKGDGFVSFPPPAIGSYLVPFDAGFAIDDAWDGVGGWIFGHQKVENVPVKSE